MKSKKSRKSSRYTLVFDCLEEKQLLSTINPSAAFVTTLYKEILGRTPDSGGLSGWVGAVNNGASSAQVANAFWNSPEHKANPIGNLATATHDADDAFVNATYQSVLGRAGEPDGVSTWDTLLDNNQITPNQVYDAFLNSPEHTAMVATHTANTAFVNNLYTTILDRPGDPAGVAGWVQVLDSKQLTQAQVTTAFENSPEHVLLVTPDAPVNIQHPNYPGGFQTSSVYQVVNGNLFGPSGPSPLDVHLVNISDSWIMASLSSVASRSPASITNMFTSLGTFKEGTDIVQLYNVKFVTPTGYTVTELVDNEFGYANPVPGSPIWAMLAEKAYVQAASDGYVVNSLTQSAVKSSSDYAIVNGAGDAIWSMQAINERASAEATVGLSGIVSAVLATPGSTLVLTTGATPADPNLLPNHNYAGLVYNAANATFTLDNPVNTASITNYGSEFSYTAAQIDANFVSVKWN